MHVIYIKHGDWIRVPTQGGAVHTTRPFVTNEED